MRSTFFLSEKVEGENRNTATQKKNGRKYRKKRRKKLKSNNEFNILLVRKC